MTPYGCRGIVGNETPEGNALLAEVWDSVEDAIVPYYHQWKPTDNGRLGQLAHAA